VFFRVREIAVAAAAQRRRQHPADNHQEHQPCIPLSFHVHIHFHCPNSLAVSPAVIMEALIYAIKNKPAPLYRMPFRGDSIYCLVKFAPSLILWLL
jgi:hypothetical protein